MKEFNNDKFNRALKDKFKGAEFEPSSAVWDGIESELLRVENEEMRKKAIWYRNIAAAVILLALVSLYYNLADRFNGDFSNQKVQTIALNDTNNIDLTKSSASMRAEFPNIVNDVIISKSSQSSKAVEGMKTNSLSSLGKKKDRSANLKAIADNSTNTIKNQQSGLNTFGTIKRIEGNGSSIGDAIAMAMPTELEKVSFFAISELGNQKVKQSTNFQANVLFGSGNFNPEASVNEGNSALSSAFVSNTGNVAGRSDATTTYNERQKVEELSSAPMRSNLSLTYGLNFGVNLGSRIVIKSGLNYGKYRATSESSVVLRDINSDKLYPYHGASSASQSVEGKVINVTSPYNLYNDFEILSVPLQLSYKLLDSRFGISIMTGATADFLLSNTLTGASDQLNTITFSQEAESAYKNIFASGLLGLELSYSLGKHYGLTLTPQFKKALTDVTKAGVGFNSTPTFASVNMSFQYIF